MFRLTDQVAVSTDITYVANFKQNIRFDGTYLENSTVTNATGQIVQFSLGFVFP